MNLILTLGLIFLSLILFMFVYFVIETTFSKKVLRNILKNTYGKNWKDEYKTAIFNIIASNNLTDDVDSLMEVYYLLDDGTILILSDNSLTDLVIEHVRLSLEYSQKASLTVFEKNNLSINTRRILDYGKRHGII